jgi:cytoskeletal protein CcmA (bactofilin family)
MKKGANMLKKPRREETYTEPKARPVSSQPDTIIGDNVFIEGNIRGEGNLMIEGTVKGKIELAKHHLTVGLNGQVEAEIQAGEVTVSGHLIGNITALDKVMITKTADFNGEIKAKRISVEDGAMLKASIELERESPVKDVSKSRPDEPGFSTSQKEPFSLAGTGAKGE